MKLLDDFVFTGPKNFTYHALILEYLPGGDLSEYLKEKLLNGKIYQKLSSLTFPYFLQKEKKLKSLEMKTKRLGLRLNLLLL